MNKLEGYRKAAGKLPEGYWKAAGTLAVMLASSGAMAAEDYPCTLYTREAMRAYVRTIPPADIENTSEDHLHWVYTKFFSHCTLLDEVPVIKDMPSDDAFVANLWSQLQMGFPKPAQAAPQPNEPAGPPPVVTRAPLAKPAAVSSNQQVCVKAKMRTVWSGKSWRCAK